MKHTKRFSISPVSAAVALALGLAIPSAAFAAGMPGAGTVTLGGVTLTGGTLGTNINNLSTITGLPNGATIKPTKPTVIQWGGPGAPTDTINSGGFNVLAGDTLNVANTAKTPILNVDASGNMSTIAGAVIATGNLFIANSNGIMVAPGATISAPVVGLIGANLATTATEGVNAKGVGNLALPTAGPQVAFTTGKSVDVAFGAGGNMSIAGAINNGAGNPAQILIAGSGSVNVNATGFDYSGSKLDVLGGVGFTVTNGAAAPVFVGASGVPAANAYAATNVSLTNAAPTSVYADGNLTFSGFSTLPATAYGWSGVLENTAGSTLFTPSTIKGSGSTVGVNPWFLTKSATGTGFVETPVGSINNAGLLQTVTTGLTTTSNGFTNTGTLRIGAGGALSVTSGTGDINLGGTVQGTTSNAAIASAKFVTSSGNINVSAPLTITGTSTQSNATLFSANATGNVSISSAVAVTSTNTSTSTANGESPDALNVNSSALPVWSVNGNSVTISGAQTVTNSNGTNEIQPYAQVTLNKNGGAVNITSTGSLTAGDIFVGSTTKRAALTLDGQLTATNTGYTTSNFGGDVGSINIGATYIQTSATENMTAQQFNFDYTRYANKYKDRSATGFIGNGVLITPVGSNPTLNLAETGSNLQNTNITAAGNITVNANSTAVQFAPGAFYSGLFGAGTVPGNSGSNVVLTSSGNLTLGSSSAKTVGVNGYNGSGAGSSFDTNYLGDSGVGSFWLPGSLYLANINSATAPTGLSSAGSITVLHDVYNDYLLPVAGGKGIFFGTNNLTVNGSLFTNMNSLVNFTTAAQQAQYQGQVYQVQYSPSNISNTLNVVPNSGATKVYPFNNF